MKPGIAAVAAYSLSLFPCIYSLSGSLMGAFIATALGSIPVFIYFKQQTPLFINLMENPDRQKFLNALLGTKSYKNKE